MGLDIIVEDSEGNELSSFRASSYSGFNEFREILAKEVGIKLRKMIGFDGLKEWEKDTPFLELLNHSDCDGKLTFTECKRLLKDFKGYFNKLDKRRRIIAKLENSEESWFLSKMKEWEEAIELAVDNKGRMIFC